MLKYYEQKAKKIWKKKKWTTQCPVSYWFIVIDNGKSHIKGMNNILNCNNSKQSWSLDTVLNICLFISNISNPCYGYNMKLV